MTLDRAYELLEECREQRNEAQFAGQMRWAESFQLRLASLERIIREKERAVRAEKANGGINAHETDG